MRKVLIADNSEEFAEELADILRGQCLIRSCTTGSQALEQLRRSRPDLLVMDVMLPELDGVSLLQAIRNEGLDVTILVLTRSAVPYVMDAVDRYEVDYVMMKPCKMDALRQRILDLASQEREDRVSMPDMRNTVTNLLLSLRFSTKLRGYSCTREAVLYLMRDPEMSLTKELYPAVAQLCDGNAVQVERAIRGAIKSAWKNKDETIWPQLFSPCADGTIPRPSNAVFLTRLADQLLLEQNGSTD